MIKKSPLALAAILLALNVSSTSSVSASPLSYFAQQTAEKKDPAKDQSIRAEWSKPYTEIQKLIGDKQYAEALEKMKFFVDSANKSPYESFFISRTTAVIASSTGNNTLLAQSFEEMIDSDFLSPAEKLKYAEGMSGTFFNEKKYKESLVWTKRYLAANKENTLMQDLLTRNLYLSEDYPAAARVAKEQIEADLTAKLTPSLERLRLLHSAYIKMKDNEGITKTLEMIAQYQPSKEYWTDLLYRLPSKAGFSDRLRLDWYRLMLRTDSIEDGSQYVEMAEIALLAGLPLEAKNIMEAGYKANLLGIGKNAAKHKPLLDKAIRQAAEDAKTLDAGEASAKSAKSGLGMANMGYNFVIHGQFEKGIAMIEQGIAKGGMKSLDEAKLHLGMAYLQAGNKEKATEVLKEVRGTDGSAELARYWLLIK